MSLIKINVINEIKPAHSEWHANAPALKGFAAMSIE